MRLDLYPTDVCPRRAECYVGRNAGTSGVTIWPLRPDVVPEYQAPDINSWGTVTPQIVDPASLDYTLGKWWVFINADLHRDQSKREGKEPHLRSCKTSIDLCRICWFNMYADWQNIIIEEINLAWVYYQYLDRMEQ